MNGTFGYQTSASGGNLSRIFTKVVVACTIQLSMKDYILPVVLITVGTLLLFTSTSVDLPDTLFTNAMFMSAFLNIVIGVSRFPNLKRLHKTLSPAQSLVLTIAIFGACFAYDYLTRQSVNWILVAFFVAMCISELVLWLHKKN